MNRISPRKQQQIAALCRHGYSIRDICKRTKAARGTVQSFLDTKKYSTSKDKQIVSYHKRVVKARKAIAYALTVLNKL